MDADVFVYGTLTDPDRVTSVLGATGEADRESERGSADPQYEFVGQATLDGLRRVDGRYPTLAPGGSVDGRLLTVDEAGLERLDRYEGVDSGLYVRVAVPDARDATCAARASSAGDRDDRWESAADGAANAADRRCWVYVGDPDRLGVDAAWPGSGSFSDRVRNFVSRPGVSVRILE